VADIRWHEIRAQDGSQEDGFEELCAQLARVEAPHDSNFFRTGEQDAGVECYCVLPNSDEWGWQAKFFTEPMQDSQLNQLDRSVKRALDTHPRLRRYHICVPRNRSDGRRKSVTTELQRYRKRQKRWEKWSAERGMDVEFVWWGASELKGLLEDKEQAGLAEFWFGGVSRFSQDWFRHRLDEAIVSAGSRYTPTAHIDVSVSKKLDLFAREPGGLSDIRERAGDLREAFARSTHQAEYFAELDQEGELIELKELAERIPTALSQLPASPDLKIPIGLLAGDIDRAMTCAEMLTAPISERAATWNPGQDAPENMHNHQRNPYEEQEERFLRLQGVLGLALDHLQEAEPLVNGNVLLLKGEAGIGKTHLLCDFARNRLKAGQPTVLLMGQRFLTKDDPWVQALQHLHLGALEPEQFLGALEAAAQVANAPALLIVDAINDGEGPAIWPGHLGPFLETIKRFPWISCIISVRSTFDDAVVPDHVRTEAVTVTHNGFVDRAYDAARAYFAHYGIDLPSTPLLQPEFDNPLFLKLYCQSLQARGVREISRRHFSLSDLFEGLLEDVNQRLSHGSRLDFNPRDRLVQSALAGLAAHFVRRGSRWVPQSEAAELIDACLPRVGFSRSLYRALVSEGLLLEGLDIDDGSEGERVISLTYERFADHLIAKCLIESRLDDEDPAAAFRPDGQLATLSDERNFAWRGVLEALCIQIPERFGSELPGLMPELFDSPWGRSAFLDSLAWRRPEGCSEETRVQFITLLRRPDGPRNAEVFDALLLLSTIPDHPLNASFLDELLRRWSMPERDARWSIYLHDSYTYQDSGPVNRLLDWASEQSPEIRSALDAPTVELMATTFTWMLTASNRYVRDRATKGLVWLLTDRIDSLVDLIERFQDIDDPYVAERIYAAAYGIATRCHDPEEIKGIATWVYRDVFADDAPPTHILLRDFARGVVERALYLGADVAIDENLIRPPYRSEWPDVPNIDELTRLAPRPDVSTDDRYDVRRAENAIHFSVLDWDFARYIIGTNHKRGPWLVHRQSEEPWRDPGDLLTELEGQFSASSLRALSEHRNERRKHLIDSLFEGATIPINTQRPTTTGESTELDQVVDDSSEVLADDEERDSSTERVEELLTTFLSSLNPVHRERYLALERARAENHRFDTEAIQRYVLWRVFDLGWTAERFGSFDLHLNERWFRESHKPERIGKKYQWIAYHEMLAYLSDHYQFDSGYSDDRSRYRFNGPWQIHLRDIDPTAPTQIRARHESGEDKPSTWWRGYEFDEWRLNLPTKEWLNLRLDDWELTHLFQVTNPQDGSRWLNLRAFRLWRDPGLAGSDDDEDARREVWIRAHAYLVDAERADEFYHWAQEVNLLGLRMPEPGHETEIFLGEHGWSPAYLDKYGGAPEISVRVPIETPDCPTTVYLTAAEYLSEGSSYDCSLQDSHTFLVPQLLLTDGMDLRWRGHDTDFLDIDGQLAAFASDPVESDASLLIREDLLRRFLEREGLALVWTVIGEKELTSGRDAGKWSGSLELTGGYRFNPAGRVHNQVEGSLRFDLRFPEE